MVHNTRVFYTNFCDAILDGTELIAPGEEGIKSVELANAMLLSSHRQSDLNFPISHGEYEQHLKKLIALSDKELPDFAAPAEAVADMSKSF